jgi:hypothetical protein
MQVESIVSQICSIPKAMHLIMKLEATVNKIQAGNLTALYSALLPLRLISGGGYSLIDP